MFANGWKLVYEREGARPMEYVWKRPFTISHNDSVGSPILIALPINYIFVILVITISVEFRVRPPTNLHGVRWFAGETVRNGPG